MYVDTKNFCLSARHMNFETTDEIRCLFQMMKAMFWRVSKILQRKALFDEKYF